MFNYLPVDFVHRREWVFVETSTPPLAEAASGPGLVFSFSTLQISQGTLMPKLACENDRIAESSSLDMMGVQTRVQTQACTHKNKHTLTHTQKDTLMSTYTRTQPP